MTHRDAMRRLSASFAAMSDDSGPRPGTPLAEALAATERGRPLEAQKALTDHVEDLLGCDLEQANELLGEWSTAVEMAADVAELTEED